MDDCVEDDIMKKFYTEPELEITVLLSEDILSSSLDDEVDVDLGKDDFFGD